MPDTALITVVHEGPVTVLGLNRPAQRNAQTPEMLELLASLASSLPDATRALVLAGNGPAFCAGFDMRLVHDDPAALPALLRTLSVAVRTIRRLPIPVVAGAHGAAVAGGCALLAAADIVVTDLGAKLGYPVLRLGVSPGVNGAALAASIGPARARERSLEPELICGEEARRIGLAHICVDLPEDVAPRAISIARHLATKPPEAIAATKSLLNTLSGLDRDEPFERSLAASMALAGNDEQRSRVAALWASPAPSSR